MQEIQETFRTGSELKKIISRTVGYETPTTDAQLDMLRREALERTRERVAAGDTTASVAIREHRHIGRNDPCPCGSGSKFKKCCGRNITPEDARITK